MTDLPGIKTEEAGITVEIFGSWTGPTLSLQSTGFQYVVGELDVHKDVKVYIQYTEVHCIINKMVLAFKR